MLKRFLTAFLALVLVFCFASASGEGTATPAPSATAALLDSDSDDLPDATRNRIRVGNPTQMSGRFFTDMFGGTTSDLDVQEVLEG